MIPKEAASNPAAGSSDSHSGQTLRQRAEALADERAGEMPENVEVLSPEAARRALHELRVHQIELEMQNEELRRIQEELEISRERYFDQNRFIDLVSFHAQLRENLGDIHFCQAYRKTQSK